LFDPPPTREPLEEGTVLLHGFAFGEAAELPTNFLGAGKGPDHN
jgi:hypothetical protein